MNRQLTRLFAVFAAGFVLLIGATSYWQIWAAEGLANRRDNLTSVVRELSIRRGVIRAADGTVLARNQVRTTKDGRKVYDRRYPTRGMFAQAVGYSSPTANRAGLERSLNDYLTGATTDLSGLIGQGLRQLRGTTARGNDVDLTLLPAVQRAATGGLASTGLRGAAVAIQPSTGKVLALASWPSYDPNVAVRGGAAWNTLLRSRAGALLNRATQGRYAPGSTFKTVTASWALQSGRFSPSTVFDDKGFFEEYGQKIQNAGGEVFGRQTFASALQESINAIWAQVGATLCPPSPGTCPSLYDQMREFGFYQVPPIDLPSDEKVASGLLKPGTGKLATRDMRIDPARTAIGQYTHADTPLQMAMVAATIANGGTLMAPTLLDRVHDGSGRRLVQRFEPRVVNRAIKAQTAATVADMMTNVVRAGTGTAAQIPGVTVAGKTGTAQTGRGDLNNGWFIGFAPVENPQVAVAVVVEDTPLAGGAIAAPIAKAMMEAALRR